ncbi:MAG TPA: hypothetical protein VL527_13930 [Dongiaceae bacterium]|jgi:hypothetical protein|nr:hypothetical protein [Dongiaceae bacterium]
MRKLTKFLPVVLGLLLTGCTATLTNLSPEYQTRRADGLYPVAVSLNTRQASVRWDSIKPYVVVGNNFYPMQPMPLMTNRWETLIPVPADTSIIHYCYKFDWQYNAIPTPQNDSMKSPMQTLRIVTPK